MRQKIPQLILTDNCIVISGNKFSVMVSELIRQHVQGPVVFWVFFTFFFCPCARAQQISALFQLNKVFILITDEAKSSNKILFLIAENANDFFLLFKTGSWFVLINIFLGDQSESANVISYKGFSPEVVVKVKVNSVSGHRF